MSRLDVYIKEQCWACEESKRIVAEISPRYPAVEIELRHLDDERRPDKVFAAPTYVLDGRVIFMGNPTREELARKLDALLR